MGFHAYFMFTFLILFSLMQTNAVKINTYKVDPIDSTGCTDSAIAKIKKFSTDQCIEVLSLMNNIVKDGLTQEKNDLLVHSISCQYKSFDKSIVENAIYDVMRENALHKSWYYRMLGLFTFTNILWICLVFISVLFVVFLAWDILKHVSLELLKIIFTKQNMYLIGYGISFLYLFYKIDDDKGNLEPLFIFSHQCSLFGALMFNVVTYILIVDIVSKTNSQSEIKAKADLGQSMITIMYIVSALYHQNNMIGTLTVMYIFSWLGFSMGAVFGGYQFGFKNSNSLQRCLGISIILNSLFGYFRVFGYKEEYSMLTVFETGVLFWATFIGLLALLILQTGYTSGSNNKDAKYLYRFIMIPGCFFLMYLGTVYDIEPYKNLGGTYLMFVLLDVEKDIFLSIGIDHITFFLFVICLTLYGLIYIITKHSEYFIFS